MPIINAADGCPINVEVAGNENAPVLMLGNSLGTDLHMWDDQAAEFAKHFRLIRLDRRGHGQSGSGPGPYDFALFGRDILAVLDALNIKRMNWCGLSMGGMDGQWLGAHAADRIDKLVLANTNFHYPDKGPWADRIKVVHEKGLASFVDANMQRWFTKGFIERSPQAIDRMKEMFLGSNPEGYAQCVAAVRDIDFAESNARISAPTLVIVGKHDPATPPERGREMVERQIKGAKLAEIDAAHISNVEQPKAFTEAVIKFLLE